MSPAWRLNAYVLKGSECTVLFEQSFGGADIKPSQDGKSLQGKMFSLEFLSAGVGGGYKVSYNNDSQKIKFSFETKNAIEPFKMGDGKCYFGKDRSSQSLLIRPFHHPNGTCSGSWQLKNETETSFSGVFAMVHLIDQNPPKFAQRLNIASFVSPNTMLALIQIKCNDAYQGDVVNFGYVVHKGQCYAATRNDIKDIDLVKDSLSGYKLPKQVEYLLSGTNAQGETISVKCNIQNAGYNKAIDKLAEMPYLVRKLIQVLAVKPFTFFWWSPGKASLSVNGDTVEESGNIFQEGNLLVDAILLGLTFVFCLATCVCGE
jgi:hypothetical protein